LEILRVTVDLHNTSLLMMVSRDGTVMLNTCAEVVWEMALKGWAVMFWPPLYTWNLTLEVMQLSRSSLTRIFSNVSLILGIYRY
jgi:hypothetical protein